MLPLSTAEALVYFSIAQAEKTLRSGPTRSVGQEFCERRLHRYNWPAGGLQHSVWVEDYDLYRTLREAWAHRRNTPSTRYPAGWGTWRGEEYARSLENANRVAGAARDGEVPVAAAMGDAVVLENGEAPAIGAGDDSDEGN